MLTQELQFIHFYCCILFHIMAVPQFIRSPVVRHLDFFSFFSVYKYCHYEMPFEAFKKSLQL